MRLTIGKRITTGFGLVILILFFISLSSYRSTKQLVETSSWSEHTYKVISTLQEVAALLSDGETGQRGYLLTGEDPYLEPYRNASTRLSSVQQELRTLTADNATQQARLDRLDPVVKERVTVMDAAISLRKEKGIDAARQFVSIDTGKRLMDDARRILAEMSAEEQRLLRIRELDARQSVDAAYASLWIGGALALLVVVVASYAVTRSITRPIAALVSGAELIGAGDLGHRITLRGNNDETSDLAEAFNRMAERRQNADTQIAAHTADRQRVLEAVTDTVQKLSAASQELLAGATQQASGMQQQAAAVAETVTVVDEVAHTSTQAAERAKTAATSARRSEEIGRGGRKAVDEVVTIIGAAKDHADSVAAHIASLAEQTQAIGEIVAVITDIAEQTNLLALNAAIEASRAGEHGRGFSVVASEVKILADESKKATHRVRQILSDIQRTANTTVLSTEEGTRSMNMATRTTAAAGDTIQSLEAVIAEVAEAAAQIAASAGQQATGLAQVNQAMRDINQVSSQNLAATHQAQRAAADLAMMGNKLSALLATS